MNRYYRHQNGEVIAATAERYAFKGDTFWWKIDRAARTVLDERTGLQYQIPDGMDLT